MPRWCNRSDMTVGCGQPCGAQSKSPSETPKTSWHHVREASRHPRSSEMKEEAELERFPFYQVCCAAISNFVGAFGSIVIFPYMVRLGVVGVSLP